MAEKHFDALVIGSGACGGWAAKQLTEAGLRVVVLEAGGGPLRDTLLWHLHRVRTKLGYRIQGDAKRRARQGVQSQSYAWAFHPDAFVDDVDHPYTTPADAPFTWIRARQVGGRTSVRAHGRQFYRLSDFDLKAGSRDGHGPDWPLTHAELAPHYETVERWMGLRGAPEGLPTLPDSAFAAHAELSPSERRLKERLERRWPERRLIARRTAASPVTLPAAARTGRLTLRTGAVVSHLLHDAGTGRVSGAAYLDAASGRAREVRARLVVLAAGTIESARILLASRSAAHPEGLGNSSGQLGRNLMDHTYLLGIEARMGLPAHQQSPADSWAYVPQFRNVHAPADGFLRGYGVQVFTMGDACHMVPFGEMLPRPENRVTLDPERKDRWGLPVPHIRCKHSDNELRMAADAADACVEMLTEAGYTVERTNRTLAPPGTAVHEVGTARMGHDPRTSVLNPFNQSWDVKNLFVTDGSCFPSQGPQNPTLTMMALTVRACAHAVAELRAGRL